MSRSSRLTADVTLEAHNLLRDYCEKHERSKGFLLEKMIRRYCSVEVEASAAAIVVSKVETAEVKVKGKRFIQPEVSEIANYMIEKGANDTGEAHKFRDFYESNGWKVGKNKMKCWKAAVRNWLKGNNNGSTKSASKKLSAYERTREANAEYRQQQPNEREVGMGADGGHLGRTVDEGKGRATIEHVGDGTFIDYE